MSGRRFEVACISADDTALAGAAAGGLGVAPLIEALASPRQRRSTQPDLPPLPPVTLSLLSHSSRLGEAARQWVGESFPKLERI
jgi:hypothetical protein